jgi:hypothetical protein
MVVNNASTHIEYSKGAAGTSRCPGFLPDANRLKIIFINFV